MASRSLSKPQLPLQPQRQQLQQRQLQRQQRQNHQQQQVQQRKVRPQSQLVCVIQNHSSRNDQHVEHFER